MDITENFGHSTYASLKGRATEALIEGMLQTSGFRVKRRGQEWLTLRADETTITSGMFSTIHKDDKERYAPDLAALDRKSGKIYFIEVKFRTCQLNSKDRQSLRLMAKHWPNAKVIIARPEWQLLTLYDPPLFHPETGVFGPNERNFFEAEEFRIAQEWKPVAEKILNLIKQFSNKPSL